MELAGRMVARITMAAEVAAVALIGRPLATRAVSPAALAAGAVPDIALNADG